MNSFELRGAHVVVTGASSGVGEALSRLAAARGANVSLVARRADRLHSIATAIGGNVVAADLADRTQVDCLPERLERHGPVDVLINNAALPPQALLVEADPATLRATLAVNLDAPVMLTRAVLPGMRARGRGRIGYVCSVAGMVAVPGMNVYSGTKAGLTQFGRCVQREIRRSGVAATVVQLGEVGDTAMWHQAVDCSPQARALRQRLNRSAASTVLTPTQAALAILDAVVSGRPTVCVPAALRPMSAIRELPTRVMDLAARGIY